MPYLCYLCLLAYSGDQHISNTYCVVFLFCLSSSCILYVASFSGLFLFCLSSSCVLHVASFSGLSIFDCLFGFL